MYVKKDTLECLYGIPCILVNERCTAGELWASPKQWTRVAHVFEFISSAVGDIFRLALCFFLFVKPIIVPHSE